MVELDLKKEEGPFAIVPCAWDEGWESQYFLNVYTATPSELHPCSDSDVPRDAVTGEVLKGDLVSFTGEDGEKDFVLARSFLGGRGRGVYHPPDTFALPSDAFLTLCPIRSHQDEYRKLKADKCVFCNEPVTGAGGKFSGSYFQVDAKGDSEGGRHPYPSGKVHKEVSPRHSFATALRCTKMKLSQG